MLKSKIHRATLTGARLDYEGSIAVDAGLMRAADMLAGEQVHVLNTANGSRLVTYLIAAPSGSGTVMLNGPAARMGAEGDEVVILSYGGVEDWEAAQWKPRLVFVDKKNRICRRSCGVEAARHQIGDSRRNIGDGNRKDG
jgi:aspartate 1-decarboxylase